MYKTCECGIVFWQFKFISDMLQVGQNGRCLCHGAQRSQMAPRARSKLGAPSCSKLRSFGSKCNCIEGSTCDIVGTFPRPSLDAPLVFVSVLHSPGVCFFRSIHVITAVQAVSYEWPPTLFRERHSGDPLRKKLNYHSFQGSSPTRWSCDTSPWPWTAPTPWIWASSVTCSTLRGFLLLAKMNLRLTRVQG